MTDFGGTIFGLSGEDSRGGPGAAPPGEQGSRFGRSWGAFFVRYADRGDGATWEVVERLRPKPNVSPWPAPRVQVRAAFGASEYERAVCYAMHLAREEGDADAR